MWLSGRQAPDFKTIADLRHDNPAGIRNVFRHFVSICRQLKLLSRGAVAVDGSKFKAVNTRDLNFTPRRFPQERLETSQLEQLAHEFVARGHAVLAQQPRLVDIHGARADPQRLADLLARAALHQQCGNVSFARRHGNVLG